MVLTLPFLCCFHFLFDSKRFPRVNDVDYCAWSRSFEVLQKCPSVAAVGVRGIYALGRKVIELLKVSVPVDRWFGNGTRVIE